MKPVVQRVRMFCGPNGSGKTTLLRTLARTGNAGEPLDMGVIVNADDMLKELTETRRLDLSFWGIALEITSLERDLADHELFQKAEPPSPRFSLEGGVLTVDGSLNAYHTAALADVLRKRLLDADVSFTFETVMSHDSKIQFLKDAQSLGRRTYVYWITTEGPMVNLARVAERVGKGGHDVAPDKVVSRYDSAHALLPAALRAANRGYLFDNSGSEHRLVAEWKAPKLIWRVHDPPDWLNDLEADLEG